MIKIGDAVHYTQTSPLGSKHQLATVLSLQTIGTCVYADLQLADGWKVPMYPVQVGTQQVVFVINS